MATASSPAAASIGGRAMCCSLSKVISCRIIAAEPSMPTQRRRYSLCWRNIGRRSCASCVSTMRICPLRRAKTDPEIEYSWLTRLHDKGEDARSQSGQFAMHVLENLASGCIGCFFHPKVNIAFEQSIDSCRRQLQIPRQSVVQALQCVRICGVSDLIDLPHHAIAQQFQPHDCVYFLGARALLDTEPRDFFDSADDDRQF